MAEHETVTKADVDDKITTHKDDVSAHHAKTTAGEINLADLAEKDHASLTNITAAQHHARYTDAEVLLVAAALVHAARHQNGGADEISIAGLSGLLADDQHVLDAEVLAVAAALVHAARHQNGGADEISVAGLSGLLADDQHVLDAEAVAAANAAGLALASGKNIKLISALTTNDTWSGLSAVLTAGEVLALGNAVYLKGADSRAWKALATATTTMPGIALATCATTAGNPFEFLLRGFMRHDAWNWTPGGLLYIDRATAGALTQTIPATTGDQVQVVGIAITADIILFNPSYELVEIS